MTEKEQELYEKFKENLVKDFILVPRNIGKNLMRPQDILEIVSQYFGCTPDEIKTRSRRKEHIYARQFYYKLAKDHTTSSFPFIAKHVNRVHACVLNGIKRLEGYIDTEPTTRKDYEVLKNIILQKK